MHFVKFDQIMTTKGNMVVYVTHLKDPQCDKNLQQQPL